METLPLEITADIYSSLPLVSQLQSREVCKTWRTLLPKPKKGLLYGVSHIKETKTKAKFFFSERNSDRVSNNNVEDDYFGTLTKLDHSLIMPSSSPVNKSFMVGSCNGLLCYACSDGWYDIGRIYICNPITGEQITFHVNNESEGNAYREQAIGFGYNRSSNEYKVVRVQDIILTTIRNFDDDYYDDCGRVQVYTLLQGGTGWKIKSSSRMIKTNLLSWSSDLPLTGIFSCGSLHWIHVQQYGMELAETVAFDLKNETFKLLPPIPSTGHRNNLVELMVLGGNLCVLEVVPSKHVKIWEYTHKHVFAWVLKLSIAWEDYNLYEPISLTKREQCLLWYNAVLSCYDPKTNTLRKLDETLKKFMDDCTRSLYTTARATPHVNSLDSLKHILYPSLEGRIWHEKKSYLESDLGGKSRRKKKSSRVVILTSLIVIFIFVLIMLTIRA